MPTSDQFRGLPSNDERALPELESTRVSDDTAAIDISMPAPTAAAAIERLSAQRKHQVRQLEEPSWSPVSAFISFVFSDCPPPTHFSSLFLCQRSHSLFREETPAITCFFFAASHFTCHRGDPSLKNIRTLSPKEFATEIDRVVRELVQPELPSPLQVTTNAEHESSPAMPGRGTTSPARLPKDRIRGCTRESADLKKFSKRSPLSQGSPGTPYSPVQK